MTKKDKLILAEVKQLLDGLADLQASSKKLFRPYIKVWMHEDLLEQAKGLRKEVAEVMGRKR